MKYIYKSLEFSQQNLGLLVVFICINLVPFAYSIILFVEKNENILYRIISILLHVISFFFISGTYSIIWKRFKNEHINFSLLIHESKKYFCNVFGINIIMGILIIISIFILSLVFGGLLNISIFTEDDYINFEFSIIIAISSFLVTLIYCYAIPYLYVKKVNSKRAFRSSPKILLKYKNESKPIILLIIMFFLISIFQLNNKGELLPLAILGAVIIQYIYFFIFLIACQILDEIDISN